MARAGENDTDGPDLAMSSVSVALSTLAGWQSLSLLAEWLAKSHEVASWFLMVMVPLGNLPSAPHVTTLATMASRLISILLGLTLLGWVVFAYTWRSQLHVAQDEIEALKNERDSLRRQIGELEKVKKAAMALPVAETQESESRESRRTSRSGPAGDVGGTPNEPWRGGGPARFMAMMDKPEIQRLMGIQQKAALDSRFASLFHSLNLNPADLDKFKDLLVEKQTAAMDAFAAARAQGLSGPENREAVRQAIVTAQAEVDNTIRTTLGDAAYAQYQTYEQTAPERNVVTQLQQRLSYSSTPLTDAQSDQIIALLAANAPQPAQGSASSAPSFFGGAPSGMGPGQFRILNSAQLAALTQLQQEQQAQALLAAQMRASRQAGTSTPNPPPPPGAP